MSQRSTISRKCFRDVLGRPSIRTYSGETTGPVVESVGVLSTFSYGGSGGAVLDGLDGSRGADGDFSTVSC